MIETGPNGIYPHIEVDEVDNSLYIALRDSAVRWSHTYDNGRVVVYFSSAGDAVGIDILERDK